MCSKKLFNYQVLIQILIKLSYVYKLYELLFASSEYFFIFLYIYLFSVLLLFIFLFIFVCI